MPYRRFYLTAVLSAAVAAKIVAADSGVALVRHAPVINGMIDGSVQQMVSESATLNGGALIMGDWLVPGEPTIRVNGHPIFAGTVEGTGVSMPTNYQVTLNGSASLRHVVRRTDPVALPVVPVPPQPSGMRTVTINARTDSPGSYATLRNLTLNGNVGQFSVPPGTYGDFTANGGSGFTLGVPGAKSPSVYNLQHLTLNGQAQIQILGPVILVVANGFAVNGAIGTTSHPEWLTLQLYSIGLTLNGGASVYGYVTTPNGTVLVNGNSVLTGGVICDRLMVNGGGVIRVAAPPATNDAPVANDEIVQLNEDTAAMIALAATDADGDPLQYTTVTQPAHGSLSGTAPNLIYTPQLNYNGADSFTFQANDGHVDSNVAMVTINVAPVNDAPTAMPISIALDEDTPTALTLLGSDADSPSLAYNTTNPAHGRLSGTAPNLTYTPDLNYNGPDSFTYTVSDGQLTSAPALVSLVVRPVNDAPVAQNQALSVNARGILAIQLTATDIDSSPVALAFTVTSNPAHGTLSGTAPNLVYTPEPSYGGTDFITFTATDGELTSAPATITINISPNHPPVVTSVAQTTAEDTAITVALVGTDGDGDTLAFAIVSTPQHGTLTATAANGSTGASVVYTPNKDYNGSDSFTFKANDSLADSNVGTCSLTVTPVNDAPIAADQTAQLDEDTSTTVILSASDVDSPTLTFAVTQSPAHGTLGPLTAGPNNTAFVTYTPASNYNGPDAFTFTANDGSLDSSAATVTLTVRAVNDPPVANAQNVVTAEDTPLTITLTGSDIDTPAFTFSITTPPQHGILSDLTPGPNNTATVRYTPGQDYNGSDSFAFVADDGAATSEPASVGISVTPVNDPPVAQDGGTLSTLQGAPVDFTLLATDVEHDPLSYVLDTNPVHGILSGTVPNLTFTPDPAYRGDDFLVFHANDGQADSSPATIRFHMIAVNHAPVTVNGSATLDEDTPTTIALTATDFDSDPLAYFVVTPPLHGTLGPITVAADGRATVLYTPTKDFNGADTFSFKANDGVLDSNVGSISMTVSPVNDAPVASAAAFATNEDTPVTLTLTATDVEGDALVYSIVTPPGHGTLGPIALANGVATVTYTPAKDFNGGDSFVFKANDGKADSSLATVSLTSKPVNDAPVAIGQTIAVKAGQPANVTLTATDVDGDALSFIVISAPAHGSLTGLAPNLVYTPAQDYAGGDSFTFKANDGTLDSGIASISLSVTIPGAPPPLNAGGERQVLGAAISRLHQGTVVVNNDEWTFSNAGFGNAPSAATFARNLADWFKVGDTGRFLVYSTDFGMVESSIRTVMTDAGHIWDVTTASPLTLDLLKDYDAVFVDGSAADPNVLTQYVQQGGCVYVCGRGYGQDPVLWNTFLANYGMSFTNNITPTGTYPISSGHPLLKNVQSLYYAGGNSIQLLANASSNTEILHATNGYNMLAACVTGRFAANVSATFDSVPSDFDPASVTYAWTVVAGPGPVRFANRLSSSTNVYFDIAGDYQLRVTAINSIGSSSADALIHLVLNTPPLVDAGPVVRAPTAQGPVAIHGTAQNGKPGSTDPVTATWAVDAAPDGGTVQFAPTNAADTNASFSRAGRYMLRLTGNDGADAVTDYVEARVGVAMLPLPQGAAAWWSFDRQPYDIIHNTHGIRGARYTDGKVVNGLRLDGGTPQSAAAHSDMDVGASASGFTVEFWFRSDAKQDEMYVCYFGAGKRGLIVNREWSGQRLSFRIYDATGTEHAIETGDTFMSSSIPWTHVAAAYDRGTGVATLYLNGTAAATGNWGNVSAQTLKDLYFGGSPDGGIMCGVLDEVTLYSRPLLPDEVSAIYKAGENGKAPPEGNVGPTVVTGGDVAVPMVGGSETFAGSVIDDGFPFGAAIGTWSQVAGPAMAQLTGAGAGSTTATFPSAGTYLFRLTGSDQYVTPVSDYAEVRVATSALRVPEGAVAWWPMNNGARDVIHDAHEAQLQNGVGYDVGHVATGMKFTTAGQNARVPASKDLDIGSSTRGFSAEFWFQANAKQDEVYMCYYGGGKRGLSIQREWSGQRLAVHAYDANGVEKALQTGDLLMATSVPWTHVCVTYDRASGMVRLYVNGVIVVSANWGDFTPQTLKDLYFGSAPDSNTVNGTLDELMLYGRALSSEEVTAIFNSIDGRAPFGSGTPPQVNAGPNLTVASAGAIVNLNGVVFDDQLPFGAPVVSWTKLAGPAQPQFSDSSRAVTTAVFPSAGTYLLQLTAWDRYLAPVADTMEVRVAAPAIATPADLAAWWPFNGHTREIVKGNHDAVRANGPVFGPGNVLQGLVFDGNNDFAVVSAHSDLDIGSSSAGLSIEFWFNSNAKQDGPLVAYYGGGKPGLVVDREWSGQRMAFHVYDAAGTDHGVGTGDTFMAGSIPWTHVAATYDRTTGVACVYLNGALAGSTNWGTTLVAPTLKDVFFGNAPNSASYLNGTLDEVSLYRRAVTAAEVQAIYFAGISGKIPPAENLPPLVDLGPAQTAYVNQPLSLTATVADDALPAPGTLTYNWTKVSGPGNATFSPPGSDTTAVTFDSVGTYVIRLSVSDSLLTGSSDLIVTVAAPPPTVSIIQPLNGAKMAAGLPFEIDARAIASNGTIAKVEFYQGTTKLGQQVTPASNDPTMYFWPLSGLPLGHYTFMAVATDNVGASTTSAAVSIDVIADPGDPVAQISAPQDTTRVSAPVNITGFAETALISKWQVQYRLKSPEGATEEPWITAASGTEQVGTAASASTAAVPGSLGTFDPTSLVNGIYDLQLTVTDTSGRTAHGGPIQLVVEGNMKIGVFSLAFEDIKVPVAGIPITAIRTYDSRDVRAGDFGPGWRLAIENVRVQKNRNLGAGWYQTPQSGNSIQFYNVDPVGDRIVTVVMPDGETSRFKIGAYVKKRPGDADDASFGVVVTEGELRFYPIGDTTAMIEPLDASNQLASHFYIAGTGDQDLRADDPAVDPFAPTYNATRFRFTTKDGTKYILDETLGLLSLTDLNGNTLVVNRDAQNRVTSVVSSLNTTPAIVTSLTVHRDANGRVDYIRDPAGRDVDYAYDGNGRLSSFTNRTLDVTQFFYENASFPYYLTRIVDPRGVNAIRSEYDSNGKLIKQIDANGKETHFDPGVDTTGEFQKVTDRLGNVTTFYYDDRGNVTLKIDPLGGRTTYAYYPDSDRVKFETDHYGNVKSMACDARGNVLVETTGANTTEDPANPTTGHTTRTTYNAQSQPTQMTDADGRTQTFSYDATTGNLLSQTSGAGGTAPATTTFTYNTDGTLSTQTDALGNLTSYTYNYAFSDATYPGAVKQISVTVTDPAGAVGSDPSNAADTVLRSTRTLYDAQENQLAQIVTRHLPDGNPEDIVTRYVYDSENRLTATIMPDGRASETRYNSFGKEDKVVQWQSVTDYQAHNDGAGRVTSYEYDSRGNQTSVTYADGTSEQTHFDAENRKDWSQDRRGYRTFFVYDAVGRLISTISPDTDDGIGVAAPTSAGDSRLADNPRTQTVYDLAGRVTDSYDEMGRHTQTVYYPDGSADAGRRKQQVQVRTLGNLITTYQYDGAGNVRFVTDPRGNTVETQYDDQGRPTKVLYPATDENAATQTSTTYDLLGRRAAVTDQEGKITRYRYDGLGRLVEVRQYLDQSVAGSDADFHLANSAGSVVSTRYTYDEVGNQVTQTDALDRTTTFWTDNVGRRTKRILPSDGGPGVNETLQYDPWGNLWKRTDFAGKTTTFLYDTLNRLTSKSADPTHPSLSYTNAIARIEYDYDANGARKAARTYNGANTLLYSETTPHDERGRVSYKDTAGGRLSYTYYANNLLNDVVSSNASGINVGYRYDEVNRLETLDDGTTGTVRTSSFTYNANGSLETVTQPNTVVHTYNYDALNRLRGLIVSQVPTSGSAPTILHTYEYKLNPSGHRRQVIEGARTTTYGYDPLYRLTSESIAGDSHGSAGTISYTLDKVGNRQSRTSSVSALSSQTGLTYNARDELSTDTYDANGNTLTSSQLSALNSQLSGTDVYDFENRLIVRTKSDGTSINISYDADGNRTQKNLLDLNNSPVSATTYLVDTNNLTGYAQVVEERRSVPTGVTLKVYTYGNQLLSCATTLNNQPAILSYYTFDGHGNVRELTDSFGAVTDRYDYDAFGNVVSKSGSTPNNYLYCSEQYDPDLGLYYLRARYMSAHSGRFWSHDSYEGVKGDPASLHKYLYCSSNPVESDDPSGQMTLAEVAFTAGGVALLASIAVPQVRTAYANAASALYQAGVGVAGSVKDAILAKGTALEQTWENERTKTRAAVETETSKRRTSKILFHYSSAGAVAAIVASGVMFASDTFGSRMPKGAYATDVEPWTTQLTKKELSFGFYGHTNGDVSWFVAIDAPDFYNIGAPYDPRVNHYTRSASFPGQAVSVDVIFAGPNPMP